MNPEDTKTPTTPETPTKEAVKTEAPTTKPENIEFLRKHFADKVGPTVAKETKEKKEEPKKPEVNPGDKEKADKPAEKPVKQEPPKEEKKEPVRKVAKDPVRIEGADSLAEAAKSLEKILEKQSKKEEAKPVERELPKELARKLPDIEELEELDPKRFKGLKQKTQDFYGKGGLEDQYKAQWKKENPGKPFDEEDDEHAEFYEQNEPFVSEEDLDLAKESRLEKKVLAKAEEKLKPVKEQISREKAQQAAAPATAKYIDDTVFGLVKAVSPSLDGVDPKEWQTADPLAHKLLVRTASRYAPLIKATAELEAGVAFNEKDEAHRAVREKLGDLETKLRRLPPGQTAVPVEHNGETMGYRTFATLEEYAKASEEKRASMWTVDAGILVSQIGQEWQRTVKEEYDDLTSTTGYKPAGVSKSGQTAAKKAPQEAKEMPATEADNESSPSIGGSSTTPTPKEAEGNPNGATMSFLQKHFGRG